jgi:hypothetical protein
MNAARWVAECNIEHFRNLLKTELDPGKRKLLEELLAREQLILSKLPKSDNS